MFRLRGFLIAPQFFRLYKAHILSSCEWCTPAIFHATSTDLQVLNRCQDRFLGFFDVTPEAALVCYKLAPLSFRRSVAMLGFIHKSVLGFAPPMCCSMFVREPESHHSHVTRSSQRRHSLHVRDPIDGSHTELLKRSVYGLVRTYNSLPQVVIDIRDVSTFQRALQIMAINALESDRALSDICNLPKR